MRDAAFARLKKQLDAIWSEGLSEVQAEEVVSTRAKELLEQVFRSKTRSYAYAAITQLLAKHDDPLKDAHCIQRNKDAEDTKRFDARSICSHVVVPWEHSIGSPLGLSTDPYVNNSLRVAEFSKAYRGSQRQKEDWDAMVELLDMVEARPGLATDLLRQVLRMVRTQREKQHVDFPIPQRASLADTMRAVERFLKTSSGGARLQLLGFAVFVAMRSSWGVFDEVTTSPVNASDTAMGKAGDIICKRDGRVVMACEVKDRDLSLELLDAAIQSARIGHVKELFALVRGRTGSDEETTKARVDREFKHGMNVYLLDHDSFFALILALIGEAGRQLFLVAVVKGMAQMNLAYDVKRDWAKILANF